MNAVQRAREIQKIYPGKTGAQIAIEFRDGHGGYEGLSAQATERALLACRYQVRRTDGEGKISLWVSARPACEALVAVSAVTELVEWQVAPTHIANGAPQYIS